MERTATIWYVLDSLTSILFLSFEMNIYEKLVIDIYIINGV